MLDTALNSLEKRSFYSFLLLYTVSSFLFIGLNGFWYYTAQKSSLQSNDYLRLRHIADQVSRAVIRAHMQNRPLTLPETDPTTGVTLFDRNNRIVHGPDIEGFTPEKNGYIQHRTLHLLVSDTPQGHLNIRSVVVQSSDLSAQLQRLRRTVWSVMAASALFVVLIAWVLSKLFMRPLHQRIRQIETFINDLTHELNTPITALRMATQRAIEKEHCHQRTLRNISISTKQLFDIYTTLTYLSFSRNEEATKAIDLDQVLRKSIDYYRELCASKKITLHVEREPLLFTLSPDRAAMLFGNLISNAVKYSPAHSDIFITLKANRFIIEDHGIGIDPHRLPDIFERFHRGTDYAGGFGIGLNIVQSICNDHHIAIEVISEKGKGTRFVLTFPVDR